MKKTVMLMTAAALLMILAAGCAENKNTSTASPGNLVVSTATPHVLHVGTELTDVSDSYVKRLCTYPWLDALTMEYYQLQEDGSFICAEEDTFEDVTKKGTWAMYQDEDGYLLLRFTAEDASFDMCEFELYDSSIYAIGSEDTTYMWLRCE